MKPNSSSKIVETLIEYAVLTVTGVIGLLFLVLWQAVPPEVWVKISDTTPKSVLWALLGILTIVLILGCVYVAQLYSRSKPKLIHFSGVLWDRDHNLYCPKDETPLFQSGRSGIVIGEGVEVFQCPKCDREFSFNDEDGALIRFNKAQQNFIEKMQILPGKNFKSIKPPTIDDYFNKDTVEVLKAFGTTKSKRLGIDDIINSLDMKPGKIGHHLDILAHKNFIKLTTHYYTATGNYLYELTEIGRAYLVTNDLL